MATGINSYSTTGSTQTTGGAPQKISLTDLSCGEPIQTFFREETSYGHRH